MNWESLKRLDEAPETGVVLAYTRTKVFFETIFRLSYNILTKIKKERNTLKITRVVNGVEMRFELTES